MATRYYPADKVPGVVFHGPLQGDWYQSRGLDGPAPVSPVQWTWQLSQLNSDCGTLTAKEYHTNQQGNFDTVGYRWVTPPLDAQTLSGTLQLCFRVRARWEDVPSGFTNDSVVRYKLHAYIANGQTATVRTTIIDNHVDTVNFPGTSGGVFRSLNAAQSVSGAISAGDVIVIELGFRVVSSPTPVVTYPPSESTQIDFQGVGANSGFADAVAGDTSTSRNAWFEFSANLTEQAAPAAPANDACVDATVISALPYTSPWVNSTTSTDTNFRVWWTLTAPTTGRICVSTVGSNCSCQVETLSGNCAGLSIVNANPASQATDASPHRSLAYKDFDAVQGTQYWFRVDSATRTGYDAGKGGSVRLVAFYENQAAEADDLVIPSTQIFGLRGDQYTFIDVGLHSDQPTGVCFDYSQSDLDGNTADRLLISIHSNNVVYANAWPVVNSLSLFASWGNTSFPTPSSLDHTAQIYCTADAVLHTGWFGDGYLFVLGRGTTLPAVMNAVADDADWTDLKSVASDDTSAVATYRTLDLGDGVAPWAITVDEDTNILYYATGALYVPIAGSQEIHHYDLNTDTYLGVFATLDTRSTDNPGVKGMCVIPGESGTFGGLLVCNGDVVQRVSNLGATVRTYTPSIAMDAQSLVDVRLKADGTTFLAIDLWSTRVYEFNLETGLEVDTFQPYLETGSLVQMAIYTPDGITPPEPATEIQPIRRLRQWLLPSSPNNYQMRIPTLEVLLKSGIGLISGQGSDPLVMLSISKDGGLTWSQERWVSAGAMGRYRDRVRWTQATGLYRNAVCRIVVSDPVDWQFLAMFGEPEERSS